ncbi:MAG TPA: FMN-binding negative transcriptional regulator [Mycobacteriales bacterium]|nr:FMN-binding negative transcriptional regulator [Mycobacteriales bacterium]
MLVHPWDAPLDDAETWEFVRAQGFGHLIAPGRGRELPVVVPTQFVAEPAVDGVRPVVVLHLARPNPLWAALEENPAVLLSVAGDWAYVPSAWKAVAEEDPALGIPTTYYAAAQLAGEAVVVDDDEGKLQILRAQLSAYEPDVSHADPSVHARRLAGIRGVRITVTEVVGKFKYGGNVDDAHRRAVAERLADRAGPGDLVAQRHLTRRSGWT